MKLFFTILLCLLFVGCANKIEGTGNSIHNENVQNPNLDIPIGAGFDAFGNSSIDTKSNLNISYFKD